MQCQFQGLIAETHQYGILPLFDPLLGWLTGATAPADRANIYAAHKAVGDTHVNVAICGQYDEAGQVYQNIPGKDYTQDYPALRALLTEAIQSGFYVWLVFGADGQDYTPPGSLGAVWCLQHLDEILDALIGGPGETDLTDYCALCPGYDGVFYGWTADQIVEFATRIRARKPNAVILIEHSSGHIPLGDGGADWANGGRMQVYDGPMSEIDLPPPGNTLWQVADRLLGPAVYVRPPDDPNTDTPPWYLRDGTPRGPYVTVCIEWEGLYYWVRILRQPGESDASYLARLQAASAVIAQQRAYIKGCGYAYTG